MPEPTGGSAETRTALFDAGRALIEREGPGRVTLARIAKEAGVSRQAVYLHFGSRAGFLLALVDHVRETEGFARMDDLVREAPTAEDALRRLVEVRAQSASRLQALNTAFNAAVRDDELAARVWQKRQALRLRTYEVLAERMKADGVLRRGLSPADAAALMWATLSFETWHYLVPARGWPAAKYVRHMYAMLRRALLQPGRGA